MTMKKDMLLSYSAPEFEIFEVVVENGYGGSVGLPGFGEYDDTLTY